MEILTLEDVAKLLKVSESTVYRMVKAGMPSIKIGRAVRFRMDKVQTYLDRLSEERHRLIRRGGRP